MSNAAMFFNIVAPLLGAMGIMMMLIWRMHRQNEERTTALRVELTSKIDALSEGQTRLENGQTRLETQVKGLEDGQARLETRMTKMETRMTKLETQMTLLEDGQARLETRMTKMETRMTKLEDSQVRLQGEWGKAEIRLDQMEIGIGDLEGKTNQFNNLLIKCVDTTARTEGLVRGYFLKDDPRLLDPEYQPATSDS